MGDSRKEAIDIWLFKGTPLKDEVVQAIYDSFFMTKLPMEEKTLWKLYNKAALQKWYRKGRLATAKEVELGVSDLTGEPIFEGLQKDIYTWIVMCTGRNANKLDYTAFINDVMDLCKRSEEFVERVEKLKKFKGIKYSAFEPDEKNNDVDILTVMNEVILRYKKSIHGDNECYKKAVYYSLKYCKYKHNIKEMMTHEKVTCRKAYEEMLTEKQHSNNESKTNEKLEKDCETVLGAKGKEIDANDFVYKIIDTLKKSGYVKCSDKQRVYIDTALAKLYETKGNKKENIEKEVENLMSEVNTDDIKMTSIDLNDLF